MLHMLLVHASLFSCFCDPLNSDKDYEIFNIHRYVIFLHVNCDNIYIYDLYESNFGVD